MHQRDRHYGPVVPQKPREIAARILREREAGRSFVEPLLEAALASNRLSPANRRLVQELVYGVVRWQRTLDWLIARHSNQPAQRLDLQLLLRLGLYQLFWLDRIPDHAAIDETVQLAREFGYGPQSGFVNALLRRYCRERDATVALLDELRRDQPALGYSHPDWLVDRWTQRWGAESAAELLRFNNQPPPVLARYNTLRSNPSRLIERWREEGVDYDFRTYDWTGENLVFELKSFPPLAGLRSFKEGRFYVQDPSTLLAVHLLDPQPGEFILDRCAAPGGKTTYIAQRMHDDGRIIAQDRDFSRLALVEENCRRLGVSIVEISRADDIVFPELCAQFDRVLVDVPCSNTGVLRRRVDLRWRIRSTEIQRLHAEQLKILGETAPQVKPGGVLVYSTCSLEPEENEAVTQAFAGAHPEFALETERSLLPFRDRVDGAYVARFRRRT
jgi:16S rRNA (cytosine967-C5)-methyltransferase